MDSNIRSQIKHNSEKQKQLTEWRKGYKKPNKVKKKKACTRRREREGKEKKNVLRNENQRVGNEFQNK